MVDWQLVGRASGRYTLAYAGATAGLATVVGYQLLLVGLILVGLALLVFVSGGVGTVRAGTLIENGTSKGNLPMSACSADTSEFRRTIDADLKLLFYAVGLVVFGFVGLVVAG